MTAEKRLPKRITVAGDATVDWNLAYRSQSPEHTTQDWSPEAWTRACWQRGGASLLADLIRAVAECPTADQSFQLTVQGMEAPQGPITPDDPHFHHSYAIWSEFEGPQERVWRVKEYLGLDPALAAPQSQEGTSAEASRGHPAPDLIVLDDADLGIRDHPERWPSALHKGEGTPWILVKMSRPIAQGPLWNHLIKHCAEKLVVIATANDLRLTEVQISKGLSWERTAQDVAWELIHNPRVNSLARSAYTILSFGADGAALLSREPSRDGEGPSVASKCHLFFDPQAIEGGWETGHPGGMIGYTTCLTAGIVYRLMVAEETPDIHQGIQSGVAGMRSLHRWGYQEAETKEGKKTVVFPMERVAAVLTQESQPLAEVAVEDPVRRLSESPGGPESSTVPEFWTILHDRHRQDLDRVAERIVLEGIEKALPDVPYGRYGYLVTVDRQEIESFRTICTLVEEYLKGAGPQRPLSIGVFGAPGSGKSFGITQVANSLAPGRIETLEFNLSQQNSPAELADALHRVRDVVLRGKIPLVFWDEFDTPLEDRPLGWLRYFLAPMQDGAFRQGQISHPIGRSIFVFAGGTSYTMEGFGEGLAEEEAAAAKVPDFVSRLKGYVNVLGPDPQMGEVDPYYIIRRAILLRSMLQRGHPALFEVQEGTSLLRMDSGVLRAFLHISRYKHGIRSMETIITMSQLSGKTSFARSSLPPESQLNLHVNGQEFLALVQQAQLEGDLLERLARAYHQFFCEQMRAKGYRYGPDTDEEKKTHSSLLPWEELPPDEKEQNRSAVRDIPNKLNRIGYVMIPARSNEPTKFPRGEDDLERLARMEHRRWMKDKLAAGWEYAPETDKEKKRHKALVPWDDERLTEEEKDKDREFVRVIPELLTLIGYTIVDLGGEEMAQ